MEPMREGISGTAVKKVQHLINEYYQASIVPESGEFDGRTTTGLKRFQKDVKLSTTGTVDKATLGLLMKPPTVKGRRIKYKGTEYWVPEADWSNFQKKLCQSAQKTVDAYKSKTEEARNLWDAHKKVRDETFFLIPKIVDVWAKNDFPQEGVIKAAEGWVKVMQAKISAGNVAELEAAISKGHEAVTKALEQMKAYRENLYSGAESLVETLLAIKEGCVITLEVSAMVATGGASVAVTAAVMGGLGAYKEVLVQIETASKAPTINFTDAFGNVLLAGAVDGTVGALLHDDGFVSGITKSVAKKLSGKVLKQFGSEVITKIVEKAVKNGLDNAVKAAVKDLVESFKPGSKMTLQKAMEDIAQSLVEGAAIGGICGKMDKQIAGFSSNYPKYFRPGDFKGLGKVDIKKALEKGAEAVIEQAFKRVSKEVVLKVADDPGMVDKMPQMLTEAIKKDSKVNADLANFVKAKKLE
jgi:hypothetical protein